MAKQKITKKIKYRKSNTTIDKNGRRHCRSCGSFLSGRGNKKK